MAGCGCGCDFQTRRRKGLTAFDHRRHAGPHSTPQWYGQQLAGAYLSYSDTGLDLRLQASRRGFTAFPKMELLTAISSPPTQLLHPHRSQAQSSQPYQSTNAVVVGRLRRPVLYCPVLYHITNPHILNAIQALRRIFSPITFQASQTPPSAFGPQPTYMDTARYFNPPCHHLETSRSCV